MDSTTTCLRRCRGALGAIAAGVLAAGPAVAAEPAVGTVIDASNVDQYVDYMPESMVVNTRRGQVLKVYPSQPVEQLMMPAWLEATERNRGKAVLLDDAGTVGLADGSPWIGGTPFPEPKSALEVMVNDQYNGLSVEADDWGPPNPPLGVTSRFLFIDGKGRQYKEQLFSGSQVRMHARLTVDPKPVVPGHEDELLRRLFIFLAPYDVKGLVTLDIVYRDQKRLPDSYIFLPTFRRVRRISTAQRADSIGGSELAQSDLSTFSDPLGMWDFKLLGKRKILQSINGAMEVRPPGTKVELVAGLFPSPHRKVQLRDAYVIEAIPRYDTLYGRKVLYIDAATFRSTQADFYDRQGKLYKGFTINWVNDPERGNFARPLWSHIYNFQTGGETVAQQMYLWGNIGVPIRALRPAAMKEFSR